jgi:hypothetical protein
MAIQYSVAYFFALLIQLYDMITELLLYYTYLKLVYTHSRKRTVLE